MPKLVAIGDSLTQGVQSGAIFETELSYPALIAEAMGLDVPNDFRVPTFPGNGLPVNIEWLLHSMRRNLGESINWFEWRFEVPFLLANRLDRVEDMYERGEGSRRTEYSGVFHNLAVSGFRVFDSFGVDDVYCREEINRKEKWIEDDFLGLPSASMYRIAQRVLNPGDIKERREWTQIRNLQELHNEDENGVENLILFLGANDCLKTVKDLQIREMENEVPSDIEGRRQYNLTSKHNLTSVEVFESDYRKMVKKIEKAISSKSKTRVFVGTIPHVTIPPITRGIGRRRDDGYFPFYAPFFITDDDFDPRDRHLTHEHAQQIDQRIDAFNKKICEIVREQNAAESEYIEWHLVNICALLDRLAVRRSEDPEDSSGPLRKLLKDVEGHPLLGLQPTPSVRLFESYNSNWRSGGFFSLDCFHPTTIGYGLIAEAFLAKMDEVDVNILSPAGSREDSELINEENRELRDWNRLNWQRLIEKDTLIQDPPVLWDDVVRAAKRNPRLAKLIYRVLS